MAPKTKVLNKEERIKVEALASMLTVEQIADYLGIARATFFNILKRDSKVLRRYRKGRAKVIAQVAKGLIQDAMDGNMTARIFFLKTQAGWSDKEELPDPAPITINLVNPNGSKAD